MRLAEIKNRPIGIITLNNEISIDEVTEIFIRINSQGTKLNQEITNSMGMYDVQPTLGNMFGFYNKYSLGHDIFNIGTNNIVVVNYQGVNVLDAETGDIKNTFSADSEIINIYSYLNVKKEKEVKLKKM